MWILVALFLNNQTMNIFEENLEFSKKRKQKIYEKYITLLFLLYLLISEKEEHIHW